MSICKNFLAEDIYKKYLVVINNIKFTPREIDIIACIFHGKSAKGITKFLSTEGKMLSARAVDTHILNIRRKIGGNSREAIIDFIESSDKYQAIQSYYTNKFIEKEFTKSLREIFSITSAKDSSFLIISWEENPLIDKLCSLLKYAGAKVVVENRNDFTQYNFILNLDQAKHKIIYIFPVECKDYKEQFTTKTGLDSVYLINKELQSSNINYINITDLFPPYFLLFEILKKIFSDLLPVKDIIISFITKYENIEKYPNSIPPEYLGDQEENVIKYNSQTKIHKLLFSAYYIIAGLLIVSITVGFVASRYFFQEDYYTQNTFEQVNDQINEFANKLNVDQILEQNNNILLLQQTIDDLYNKYPEGLNNREIESKFNYLSCLLAYYYRNSSKSDEALDNYLKIHYPYFKWFKNFNLKEFYGYVATKILSRTLLYYNNKHGINDDDSIEDIKTKLGSDVYALEDYILLNHHIYHNHAIFIMKDWNKDYRFKMVEKYLSIAALGKKYNMVEGYLGEQNYLVLRLDKVLDIIIELEKKLQKIFPISKNESSIILILNKINLDPLNRPKLQTILNQFLNDKQLQESDLKELINSIKKLDSENQKYIKDYKPWNKIELGFQSPKDLLSNKIIFCKESLRSQAALINYYTLLYYNNTSKLNKVQKECFSFAVEKLNDLFVLKGIEKQWGSYTLITHKKMLARAIRYLGDSYYNDGIALKIKIIADKLISNKFDSELSAILKAISKEIN